MKSHKIAIRRELSVPPIPDPARRALVLEVIAENANDWTHFTYVHRRHIVQYRLLFKNESREVFFYKSRRLYPLPWFDRFLVFRDLRPEQRGYRNLYYHLKTGRMNYLDSRVRETPEGGVELVGEFVFDLPFYWRRFSPLFFWVFKKRMHTLIDEDNALINERLSLKGFDTSACRPAIPDHYDLFEEFFGGESLPAADVRYRDSSLYPGLEEA